MKKLINPISLVDETGVKNSKDVYICSKCKKAVNLEKAREHGWHYKIKCSEKDMIYLDKNKMGYVHIKHVSYICAEHHQKLTQEEAIEYVEIGLPYFLSVIGKKSGIFSF